MASQVELPARVVPSGKVYRQMFDAEVQLVHALEKRESTLFLKEDKEENKSLTRSANIPLVQQPGLDSSTGMLDSRQKTWVESFPNEPHVENPVACRYQECEQKNAEAFHQEGVDNNEVRGLPDVLTPAKVGSDIIERIGKSRKQRHEAALEDMHQELGLTNQELEPKIQAAGNGVLAKLHENDKKIEALLARIELDEDLLAFSLKELGELWEELRSQSNYRQDLIKELDSNLQKMEKQRMEKVRDIFRNYAKALERIAHLMPPDLQRMLDKESQLINQTVLSNRRAYADLYSRLMMGDIEREKRLHTQWESRVLDWKRLHKEMAVADFRSYMESSNVVRPPTAQTVLDHMRTDQLSLNQKRIDLIDSLRDLKPPSSTKTSVYHWNQQIMDVSKEIDVLNQEYFTKLYAEYEKVCQKCLEEVENVKSNLLARGICSEAQVQKVIQDECLPLVGKQQGEFEHALEIMDKSLEEHNSNLLVQLKSLFKYCQGVAHIWDVHEIGLARQERALQDKLDACRHGHDNQNQEKEAQLDIIMDRMRQDASEVALKESLKLALDMLNKIREGYEEFHGQQLDIVATYPTMVTTEVGNYDKAVCKFFSVDRRHPSEKEEVKDKKKKTKSQGNQSSRGDHLPSSPLPIAVSEVLATSKGTTFYVLTVAGEHGVQDEEDKAASTKENDGGPGFLTEVKPDTNEDKLEYLANADVPKGVILAVKEAIRMSFLDHLEEWREEAVQRARSVVAAKTEELNSELDLRMHLHQPRSRRAELDVHNVRAAELVMHSERVARHCKGISQALGDLKTRFNDMTEEHNEKANKFRHDIEALEVVFINATKSAKLIALSNQLQVEQEKYMTKIRTSLRQFRQYLDDTLQMLRESNARFIKSFRVFSDGGNFCPEEIEDFRKKLEKMGQKIDSAEGYIMSDLEGMESKRLDQATKISAEFEDRFKHHMVDLVFMEKVARWLTNTQVKIKAEVANSNTQAQDLAKMLNDLDRRIDACEKPNPDKEVVAPSQLDDGLKPLFELFHERSHYLNSVKDINPPAPPTPLPAVSVSSESVDSIPIVKDSFTLLKDKFIAQIRIGKRKALSKKPSMRVGFSTESVPPMNKPGKQPVEDPSLGLIKNILKTQKSRLKGLEAEADNNPTMNVNGSVLVTVPGQHGLPALLDTREKTASHRRPAETESRSKKSSRQGTATTVAADPQKRVSSAQKRGYGSRRVGSLESIRSSMLSASYTSLVSHPRRGRHDISKGTKFDPKYLVFGLKEESGEDTHFLGKVRKLLREALDGLLSAAEVYYRTKGTRPVTRPQALQETFELCADIVVAKLQSYFSQADEFHNQCLQELRKQLQRFENTVASVPKAVLNEVLRKFLDQAKVERADSNAQFSKKLEVWESEKVAHQNKLRPALGHPQQEGVLKELCKKEDARRQQYLAGVEEQTKVLQNMALEQAQNFVDRLARMAEHQLLQADSVLTIHDVETGRVPELKHSTAELLRRQQAGLPLEDVETKDSTSRGKNSWIGLPKNKMIVQPDSKSETDEQPPKKATSRDLKAVFTASVTTMKTTTVHQEIIAVRDKAYQDYELYFEYTLNDIKKEKEKLLLAEERWTESWLEAVHKVKKLY